MKILLICSNEHFVRIGGMPARFDNELEEETIRAFINKLPSE